MSSQLKEKQQQTDKSREFEADQLFNKHLFRTLAYSGAGFGAGMVASLFFKHKKMITLLGTGAGAAYGGQGFMSDLNQYKRFKDLGSQGQQPQTLKRDDQLATKNWEDYMPKQESLSQQKRYGGSSDDDDHSSREAKSSSEKKNSSNKPAEQKSTETTSTKTKLPSKGPAETIVDNTNTFTSNRNKDLDKSSTEFGKNKGEVAKESSHDRHLDKSSQQFGDKSSTGVKSFDSSKSILENQKAGVSKGHKENESKKTETQKTSRDARESESKKSDTQKTSRDVKESESKKADTQKTSKDFKEIEPRRYETQKSSSQGVRPALDDRQYERSVTGVSEPHFNFREEGQQLQEFNSYKEPGKPASQTERHRGSERPKHSDRQLSNLRDQQNKVEQDRIGNTQGVGTGNKMKVETPENAAGSEFSGRGITSGSQTNVVIE